MTDLEYRSTPGQVRADGERRRIGGYAALFDKLSRNLGGFVEVVDPRFFNHTRSKRWAEVLCRYGHDDNMLLGTADSGTLRLWTDATGLLYEVDLPAARADVLELVARGDVRKSSFAFHVHTNGDEWGTTDQGYPLRTLVSGQLVDVAPVNLPAYVDTSVALRSLSEWVDAPIDEVMQMAERNELRRLFRRTDTPPRLLGTTAAAQLAARREDPWARPAPPATSRTPLTAEQARRELERRAVDASERKSRPVRVLAGPGA